MDWKRFEEKIEKLDTRLDSIDINLAKQESNLREHMRRTQLAEENIELLRTEIKPLSHHVATINNIAKIISALAAVVAIAKFLKG